MKIAKDGIRSIVRIGYDGKVYKTFRGTDKEERFKNEIRVLQELEARGCDYVPRVIEFEEDTLTLVTTNCGSPVEKLPDSRIEEIFSELTENYGVVHDDPFLRNITYDSHRGRFCVIDFELAEIRGAPIDVESVTSLTWSGLSRSGNRKEQNEDAMSVFSIQDGWANREEMKDERAMESGNLIFAVSDGMGGHAGGAIASELVVNELHRFIPALMGDDSGSGSPSSVLERSIHDLHAHVQNYAATRPAISSMGATVVCGLFCNRELHFGHVGDSRLYRFRRGKLDQLTQDHSIIGKLYHEGKINEMEARTNPRRNILSQAIGAKCQFVHPQVGSSNLEKGDWFMICSDGIIDGLWNKQIEEEFLMADVTNASPADVAENLLKHAYEAAGKDDTTLFVIRAN